MLKLLKNMRKREILMAMLCAVLVLGQVYFDLLLPDYMTDLTRLIKTPGTQTGDIAAIGGKMLLCTLASAVLAIGCGYLSGKNRIRIQLRGAQKAVLPRDGRRQRRNAGFLGTEPDYAHDERHHANSDVHFNGASAADQIADHGGLGGDQDSRKELGAFGGYGSVRGRDLRNGALDHVGMPPPLPPGSEDDR